MRLPNILFLLFASPAFAHELWIEPLEYQVGAETIINADLVNGENFVGTKLSYLPQNFSRFVVVAGAQFANVGGRIGDRPALAADPIEDGLHVAAYISKPSTLTYETWEKFQKFIDHKDLGSVLEMHTSRGLPTEGFVEAYVRYSKSLVGVGSGIGSDRRLGMETELVAMTNPYQDPTIQNMTLQLFYRQDVRSNEQIEVFEKAPDGTVNIFLVQTNEEGLAEVPVKSGHSYMADAVVLREPAQALAAETNAVWETLWANLTWAMPATE